MIKAVVLVVCLAFCAVPLCLAAGGSSGPPGNPPNSPQNPMEGYIKDALSGDVYFGAGSAELAKDARKTLGEVWAYLKKRPGSLVMLAGYDDRRTPAKESIELGWRRAQAVEDYLVSLGADRDMVRSISFGNTRHAAAGDGEAAWSKDRRVRYLVSPPRDNEKMEAPPSGVCQRCKK